MLPRCASLQIRLEMFDTKAWELAIRDAASGLQRPGFACQLLTRTSTKLELLMGLHGVIDATEEGGTMRRGMSHRLKMTSHLVRPEQEEAASDGDGSTKRRSMSAILLRGRSGLSH